MSIVNVRRLLEKCLNEETKIQSIPKIRFSKTLTADPLKDTVLDGWCKNLYFSDSPETTHNLKTTAYCETALEFYFICMGFN